MQGFWSPEMSENNPSNWQEKIVGDWYGCPSVFDATGTHVGYNKVNRASTFENGRTTYTMETNLDAAGPIRSRYEAKTFAFGVLDSDQDRIYMGPDFMGSGQPFGSLVCAQYYSPAWTSDLETMVHVLDDGKTQVYSSLLYDGPNIAAVFNGVYTVAFDYESNPETAQRVDAFVASEKVAGKNPHVLPFKHAGEWKGVFKVYSAEQEKLGEEQVTVRYRPDNLLRASMIVETEGLLNLRYETTRHRNGNRHAFEGPDMVGNGIAYGRALYTTQHLYGKATRIRGREFIIDDDYTMSVVWQIFESGRPKYTTYGVLNWQAGEQVLKARY